MAASYEEAAGRCAIDRKLARTAKPLDARDRRLPHNDARFVSCCARGFAEITRTRLSRKARVTVIAGSIPFSRVHLKTAPGSLPARGTSRACRRGRRAHEEASGSRRPLCGAGARRGRMPCTCAATRLRTARAHQLAAIRAPSRPADKLQRDYVRAREDRSPNTGWHRAAQPDLLAASASIHRPDEEGRNSAEAVVQPADESAGAGGQQARVAGVPDRAKSSEEALAAAQQLLAHANLVVQATGHIEAGFRATGDEQACRCRRIIGAALKALRSAQGAQGLAAIRASEALQGMSCCDEPRKGTRAGRSCKRRAEMGRAPGARCVDQSLASGLGALAALRPAASGD